jgi:hypothetical protein
MPERSSRFTAANSPSPTHTHAPTSHTEKTHTQPTHTAHHALLVQQRQQAQPRGGPRLNQVHAVLAGRNGRGGGQARATSCAVHVRWPPVLRTLPSTHPHMHKRTTHPPCCPSTQHTTPRPRPSHPKASPWACLVVGPVDVRPVDALLLVRALLQCKHVRRKLALQALVGIVDAQRLERVGPKLLKACRGEGRRGADRWGGRKSSIRAGA